MSTKKVLLAGCSDCSEELHKKFVQCSLGVPIELSVVVCGEKALGLLLSGDIDIAIIAFTVPPRNAVEILDILKKQSIMSDVIVTGYCSPEIIVEIFRNGARDFLIEPFDVDELRKSIKKILIQQGISEHVMANRLDQFVRDNIVDPKLSLKMLHKHFNISVSYISKLFREHLNSSFRQRVLYYRYLEAKELIQTSDEPFYIIAEQVGFNDYHQLTSVFRRFEKMTPREYKRMYFAAISSQIRI